MIYFLKYWKYAAAALVVVAVVSMIYKRGYNAAERKCQAQVSGMIMEAAELRRISIERAQEQELLWATLTSTEAALAAKTRAETVFVTNTVVKWKVKYAQNPNAGKCVIPAEFVRVHTAAATNRVSEAPPGGPQSDGATTGFTDVDVLDVDTANYATCHGWADQLRHMQAREIALEVAR